jgi:hypothetical protein
MSLLGANFTTTQILNDPHLVWGGYVMNPRSKTPGFNPRWVSSSKIGFKVAFLRQSVVEKHLFSNSKKQLAHTGAPHFAKNCYIFYDSI